MTFDIHAFVYLILPFSDTDPRQRPGMTPSPPTPLQVGAARLWCRLGITGSPGYRDTREGLKTQDKSAFLIQLLPGRRRRRVDSGSLQLTA